MTNPAYGVAIQATPEVRCVLAPNPGPMTHTGTNSYIVGHGRVAIVDPGPALDTHIEALLAATQSETITHILVSHAHLDHSPAAAILADKTGAEIFGFGEAHEGRSQTMQRLAAEGFAGGGEGVDTSFQPHAKLADGDVISGHDWELEVLHTPGHFAGHLAFGIGKTLISGDHVMEMSSTLVSPPDGDVADFMKTCDRLLNSEFDTYLPGHGNRINDPAGRLEWLMQHRRSREQSILQALSDKPVSLAALTQQVYADVSPNLWPAAERNLFAHLIDFVDRGQAKAAPLLSPDAKFSRLS
ncbi:MAG: MBL fold metallo-hydrolase [Boseongicola sp.]|nr:MBL fold metallo-hydrolase [Boseongicola sp.]